MRSASPVWRLLRRNISAGQIAGYAIANLVGLAIVLTAVQFYTDVSTAFLAEDSALNRDYLVVSRKINGFGARSDFSARELQELKSQPWVQSVGEFTPSRFESTIKVDLTGATIPTMGVRIPDRGLSTDAFFESLPDRYFDRLPEGWGWSPAASGNHQRVPIVISKDYLALFNFGFASSYGLPAVSEKNVSAVPLKIIIRNGYNREALDAYIAGFSSRINTIAVPQEFMDWANDHYGSPADVKGPSRLILEVNDPGNPAITDYMATHDLEVAGDKAGSSQVAFFLRLVTGIVIGVGVIISALAFFILMLSIFLLVQKSREKLRDLILLGYTPGSVSVYYYRLVAAVNGAVVALALGAVFIARPRWTGALEAIGVEPGSVAPMLLIAGGVLCVLTGVNVLVIRRLVGKAARS